MLHKAMKPQCLLHCAAAVGIKYGEPTSFSKALPS
jgi:hypothetical protein